MGHTKMQIWVDADACPKIIKEILYRAANRAKIMVTLVSNHPLSTPSSPFITKILVTKGFDIADNKILEKLSIGDIVITADIPLADAAINKGCLAVNPRGELYSENNIKKRLAIRNLSSELRDCGTLTGGPDKISKKEISEFANVLDRLLVQKRC